MNISLLCVVAAGPQTTELLEATQALNRSNPINASFLFEKEYETAEQHKSKLHGLGYHCINSDGSRYSVETAGSLQKVYKRKNWRDIARKWLKHLPDWLSNPLQQFIRYLMYTQIGAYPYWFLRYRLHLNRCSTFIESIKPNLILLAVDAAHYDSGSWIKASYNHCVPCVVIPFAMADKETLAEDRVNLIANNAVLPENWLLARLYPQWSYEYKTKKLVELPAAQAFSKQSLGIVMSHPWVYNASEANLILLESEYALDQLSEQGVELKNVIITGRVAHDEMYETMCQRDRLREKLVNDYGLNPDHPIVTAALTPDKFEIFGWRTEFKDYRSMVENWIEILVSENNIQILISVHPSDTQDNVRYLERSRVFFASEPLSRLIPLSDLYVTDCSATARIAAACGVPVLDYDLYQFNLKFNQVGDGLVYVNSKSDFEREWKNIWSEKDRLKELSALQSKKGGYYSLLDGGAEKRIVTSLVELTRR